MTILSSSQAAICYYQSTRVTTQR